MKNPRIAEMDVYPLDRKRDLFAPLSRSIFADLTIGEPQHDPDPRIAEILHRYAHEGIRRYPRTKQESFLTDAIIEANCTTKSLAGSIHEDQVIAGCGSGELLYSCATASIDPSRPYVLIPNPAYQVYRLATTFAGGVPYFFDLLPENNFQPDLSAIPKAVLSHTSLCYINTPNNPCAVSYTKETLRDAVLLAREYGFTLASDECYGDIYSGDKPTSILEICASIDGNNSFKNVIAFDTLSKRSSVPGLRSGSMVGDIELIRSYLKLRLSERKVLPHHVQRASAFAWTNLKDVEVNRLLYSEKLFAMHTILNELGWNTPLPTSTFYGWLDIRDRTIHDAEFAFTLAEATGVLVFPGSYFSTMNNGINPGAGFVRVALIDSLSKTKEAIERLGAYYKNGSSFE